MDRIYGFNFRPQDKWAHNSSNVFKINGLTADEWVAAGNGTFTEFWDIRTQKLVENFNKIWSNSSNPSQFPLDGLFRMLGSTNNQAVLQVLDSIDEWKRFAQIKEQGGKAIGFDLETFGEITKTGTNPSQFGITEFAIGTRIYDGTENIEKTGRSYIFGINEDQTKYLYGLVDKYKVTGWDSLEKSEQIALGRMSMYSGKNAIIKEVIPEYGNKTFMVAGTLAPETRNIDIIKQGIKNLEEAYKVSKPSDIMPILIDEIIKANKNDDTVLFGANSKFDIDAIINTAKALNIDTSEINSMRSKVLDIVYSARALATSESKSVDSYIESMHGIRTGASVDNQLEAWGFNTKQEHHGYKDIENEGRLLDVRLQEIIDAQEKIENVAEQYRQYSSIEDSVFLIHRGSLNHENAQEMAIINGSPVASYSYTNEYWTIDTSKSHYVDIDGEEKYALVLNSYVDGENTNVVLIRNSREEALESVVRNASIFDKAQITTTDAIRQQEFKYKDFGRREFDRLVTPSEVKIDNGEDVYGFESLQHYLKIVDEIPNDLSLGTDSESVNKLLDYLSTKYPDQKQLSYYEAQAFVGMHEKLVNEKLLLDQIVKGINDNYGFADNIDKTVVARKAYNQAIDYMDQKYSRKIPSEAYNVMSDALGIDIQLPDESIRRINAYSVETATYDINNAFKNLNAKEIHDIVEDLGGRGLIPYYQNKDFYNNIAKNIAEMGAGDLYGISQDIAYELVKNTQKYTNTNKSIVHSFRRNSDTIKNLQFLGQKLESNRLIKFEKPTGNGVLSFSDAYTQSRSDIDNIVSNAVIDRPNTLYIDTFNNDKVLKEHIGEIAKRLNIEPDGEESKLLFELFTKTTNFKGEPTKYAINNYDEKGLRTFITQNDNGNTYLFLTREQDASRFYNKLTSGDFNLENQNELIESGIHDYASFIEIPKINEYQLDSSTLRTVNQGKIEKTIIPELKIQELSDGRVRAYYNAGEYNLFSTLRMVNGNAIKHVLHGEYQAGSTVVRKARNKYLETLSGSASYRGRVIEIDGKKTVQRIAEFTPSDFIQASEARITEGLYTLFKASTEINPTKDLNAAQQIVMAFGKSTGKELNPYNPDVMNYIGEVVEGKEFQEFFNKRLFAGMVSQDIVLNNTLTGASFNKNIFQIIKDIATNDTSGTFDKSVAEALSKIPVNGIVDQVLSETAQKKGVVSFGVRSGDYNDASSLYSTMRPTYNQQNNGMYFNLNEMDVNKFTGLDEHSIRFGTAVLAEKEYLDRVALYNSGYNPIPGQNYSSRRRTMVAKTKQLSDYDLILKYQEMQKNSSIIAKELGISESRYNKALAYFQQEYMSVYNDKIFLAPGLNEQNLFQDREGKKILYDIDNIDEKRSIRILNKLAYEETIVDRNTVIGVKQNGAPIYYEGPSTILTKGNVDELLNGQTYVIPTEGDIFDNKVMINGAEKGTTRSIHMPSFMEYTGIKNYEEALRVANSLFNKVSDGAVIIGDFGIEKHGGIMAAHSIWNTITSQYIENGKGELLVNEINRLIKDRNPAFRGIHPYRYINNEIISRSTDAYNLSYAIETLYSKIKNNDILDPKINSQIIDEIDYMKKTNTFNALVQRQNMNEHMGTRMVVDQRIEQGLRTRSMQMGNYGMDPIDNQWADMLKFYSEHYNAKGTGFADNGQEAIQQYIDAFGSRQYASRVHLLNGKGDVQRSTKGIIESIMYYYNPEKYDPTNKNIVEFNINELIDESSRLKGGMSTKELQNSIFFVDSKPSNFLKRAAEKKGVNLYDKSYSIFINLNDTSFNIGDKAYKGVLIPIQSVFTDTYDKTFFQRQQSTVAHLVNELINITTNPGQYMENSDIKTALSVLYKGSMEKLTQELGYLDKEGDVYKAFQQYIMPTSQELLAQDEAAPLVEAMMSNRIKRLKQLKEGYERRIQLNPKDTNSIAKLDVVYDKLSKELKEISTKILNDDSYYSKLMSLSGNEKLLKASELINNNGEKQYGLAVAISKDAFERQGIKVGAVGLEAFSDWETGNFKLEKIKEFSSSHNFGRRRATIAKKLNELGIEGLSIDKSRPITSQLNEFFANQYGLDEFNLSIKDLNKAMIENGGPSKVLSAFEEIGSLFLEEVGTFGEIVRYPTFRSQAMVRVILDRTLRGNQVRASSAILSSINNVDFDGDKQFLSILSNGISIINTETTMLGKNVFDTQTEIYNRFALTKSRLLLAELIEKGDVLNFDNPNALTRQYSAMLEKLKTSDYEDAVKAWAKDNSIKISSIDDLTPAQLYAASHSSQMHDKFVNMKFNPITDEDSIVSSIAARFRKDNIGYISTPNYHMRNALLEAIQDPNLSLEQKSLLNDTYIGLSNMLSEAGGFFSAAEQKSIDVKHIKDGTAIAKTTRYSTGMSMLFGNSNHTADKNIIGIRSILEAVNSGLFKASDEELQGMAIAVVNTSLDDFNSAIQKAVANGEDVTKLEYLQSLRRLLEVQKQIPNFDKIYANKLIKGTLDESIYSTIEHLNSQDFTMLEKRYAGTGFFHVLDVFANSFSADKSPYITNNLYFQIGSINGEWETTGYVYKGKNIFSQIDLNTGKELGTNKVKGYRLTLEDAILGSVNIRDYVESSAIREEVNDSLLRKKFENTLNEVLVSKKNKVLTSMPKNFEKIRDIKGGMEKYGVIWSGVNELFTGPQSKNRHRAVIYGNISELAQTYDYAVNKGFFDTRSHPSSSGELIKQLNKQIAENPRNYSPENGFIFDSEYDIIFRKELIKLFQSEEVLNRYIEESKQMGSFSDKKYREYISYLEKNTYDIAEQEKNIAGSFSRVQTEITGLQRQGVPNEDLKPLQNIIDSSTKKSDEILSALRANNNLVTRKIQQSIYNLFDSTKQMDYFFKWNQVSNSTIVGFGEFIGKEFGSLSKEDIAIIQKAGLDAQKSINSFTSREQYALNHTLDALKQYKPVSTVSARRPATKPAKTVENLINENDKVINQVVDKVNSYTKKQQQEAAKNAAKNVKKKTLSSSLDSAKEAFSKIPKKTIGITAAVLAAVGIANNLLHLDRKQSPLTPARRPNGNGSPDINGNYPENEQVPIQQAPPSQKRTIYHDNESGFNFKVSASTKNYINERNNAKLIGMSGGGDMSVYSQSDMSGVTDNWLANKFAELA